jgi:hypothetical protein
MRGAPNAAGDGYLPGERDHGGYLYSSYTRDELELIVAEYPDFKHERMQAEVVCNSYEFEAWLLPKFHCDINPLELVWAWLKRKINSLLTGNIVTLMRAIADALASISRPFHEHWTRRIERYLRAYAMGIPGQEAFKMVLCMTGRGSGGVGPSHLRPGVIDPYATEDKLDGDSDAEEEQGAGVEKDKIRRFCTACNMRDKGLIHCSVCQQHFHEHCTIEHAGDISQVARPARASGGGPPLPYILCDCCQLGLQAQQAMVPVPQGPNYREGVLISTGKAPAAWVPEVVSDAVLLGLWQYLEFGMGRQSSGEAFDTRFSKAKGRFKAAFIKAAIEMGKALPGREPISLAWRALNWRAQPIAYIAPDTSYKSTFRK